jgi:trigger factor
MQASKNNLSDTKVKLTITASPDELQKAKEQALKRLGKGIKVPGFREGKAPLNLVENHLAASQLQAEFLDLAINDLYIDAASTNKLRPVTQPDIKIIKFVPFDTLEIAAEVEVIGSITLPDYKKLNVKKQAVNVTVKDVDETIRQLMYRDADKKEIDKPARQEDEVLIDFSGKDTKTGEVINGASGKDYPLWLGSGTFIPGFEEHLIGQKPGSEKSFDLIFPKDYGLKLLQNRKVTFSVTIKKVLEVKLPALDKDLAAKVGPFKTVAELKTDIEKQLLAEKQSQADRIYENDLVQKLAEGTKVAIPDSLVDDQLKMIEKDELQNLTYRGQTWQEFLDSEGLNEEGYFKRERPQAELRVKAGLALAEVAEAEDIKVTRTELENRLEALKKQYADSQLQAELDKPESRQNIFNRIVTEKTVNKLIELNK